MVITLNGKTVEVSKDEVFMDPRAAANRWLQNYNKMKVEAALAVTPPGATVGQVVEASD